MHDLTKGRVLLSRAMSAAGHTVTDAASAIGCDLGALGRVLSGKRGAGMDLAVRIEAAYPTVVVRSWTERADKGEKVAEIPRGRKTRKDKTS